MTWGVRVGDCRALMAEMDDCSVDAVVCDPPYGLSKEPDMAEVLRHWLAGDDYVHTGSGFMGKSWDSFVPGPAIWKEAYRVLKPGGHLIAFFGTRTYDLGAIAIRLAGFECRDMGQWAYGQGFPKSHDVHANADCCKCSGHPVPKIHEAAQQNPEHSVHGLRPSDISQAKFDKEKQNDVLHNGMQEHGLQRSMQGSEQNQRIADGEEPFLERGSDIQEAERKLQRSEVRKGSGRLGTDGPEGRLHNGASLGNGEDVRISSNKGGGSEPHRQESSQQSSEQSGVVSDQCGPQAWRGWEVCGRCKKPIIPKGIGTALKPAFEPWILARKPLDGTVAGNVLKHGVGGLNIDGCRIEGEDAQEGRSRHGGGKMEGSSYQMPDSISSMPAGRFPANLIHDGSDDVLGLFPNTKSGYSDGTKSGIQQNTFGKYGAGTFAESYGDEGSAARFFYTAKASQWDRNGGLDDLDDKPSAASEFRPNHAEKAAMGEDGNPYGRWSPRKNIHPTVKPTDLMRYLCRLVTPPGGLVLDPFTGSGSTGRAALLEGFSFIGCELSEEYAEIARGRIAYVEKNKDRALVKPKPVEHNPYKIDLF